MEVTSRVETGRRRGCEVPHCVLGGRPEGRRVMGLARNHLMLFSVVRRRTLDEVSLSVLRNGVVGFERRVDRSKGERWGGGSRGYPRTG